MKAFPLLVAGCVTADDVDPVDRPPSPPVVHLSPEVPLTDEDLWATLAVPSVDPEGETVIYRWTWRRDGVLVPGLSGDRVPAAETNRAERWAVEVEPVAGGLAGLTAGAEVLIGDSPPTASVELGALVSGAAIEATAQGLDSDGDPVSFNWSWRVDGTVAAASGPLLPAGLAERGQDVEVRVVPEANGLPGMPVSAHGIVLGRAPSLTTVEVRPDSPTVATPLQAVVTFDDADGDVPSLSFSWFVDGVAVPSQGETLEAPSFLRGSRVAVEVVASDVDGQSAPLLSAEVLVGDAAPTGGAPLVDPPALVAGAAAACVPGEFVDPDLDPAQWVFRWLVDGLELANGPSLPPGLISRGQEVTCEATPWDGLLFGEPVLSTPVVVGNSPPGAPGVAIVPSEPDPGDALLCSVETPATDADLDALTYLVSWTLGGAPWPDAGAPPGSPQPLTTSWPFDTVPAGVAGTGDQWACEVVANDGFVPGAAGSATAAVAGPEPAPDWSLVDDNPNATTWGQPVSPRDYLEQVSGWYFIHST